MPVVVIDDASTITRNLHPLHACRDDLVVVDPKRSGTAVEGDDRGPALAAGRSAVEREAGQPRETRVLGDPRQQNRLCAATGIDSVGDDRSVDSRALQSDRFSIYRYGARPGAVAGRYDHRIAVLGGIDGGYDLALAAAPGLDRGPFGTRADAYGGYATHRQHPHEFRRSHVPRPRFASDFRGLGQESRPWLCKEGARAHYPIVSPAFCCGPVAYTGQRTHLRS